MRTKRAAAMMTMLTIETTNICWFGSYPMGAVVVALESMESGK